MFRLKSYKVKRIEISGDNVPLNIGFGSSLAGDKWIRCLHLCQKLLGGNSFKPARYFCVKTFRLQGFSVKSMYENLMNDYIPIENIVNTYRKQIRLKIKVFMWLLELPNAAPLFYLEQLLNSS